MAEQTQLDKIHVEGRVEGVVKRNKNREVLICIDGSEHADRAFEWYAENVHRVENDVICFNVSGIPSESAVLGFGAHVFATEDWRRISEENLENIKQLQAKCENNMRKHHMHGKVICFRANNPGQAICEFIKEKDIDYIVSGSRGLGTFRRTLVGSVSDFVLHHGRVPVFIVPPTDRHGQTKAGK